MVIRFMPILALSSALITTSVHADIETVGDVVAVAIPALAYGSTYYKDDKAGRQQFYYAFGTSVATSSTLKAVINKERPDHSDDDAFPSAHASAAFQGASFIHKRYGLESSIPAYIGASFVGYSRLKADKHDMSDVLAGAALGIASSMYFTKSYNEQLYVATSLAPDYYGLSLHYEFK